ncbi:MAG: transcription termination factor Rho [Bacteroidaceae bacterium]|nr:transcription termination factor Rho [Bacteroidaceae bacterium]
MQNYNKEQLTGKSLDELRSIAEEFGIKTNGLDEMGLVYEILDQSAVASAADKTSSAKSTTTKKRTRIKTVDRVYTANQEKAKKIDKTVTKAVDDSLFGSLSNEEQALMAETQKQEEMEAQAATPEVKAEKEETPETPAEEQPKKRTRKTSTKTKKAAEKETAEQTEQPSEEQPKETVAPAQPADGDFVVVEMQDADTGTKRKSKRQTKQATEEQPKDDDFIILQDIPAEDFILRRNEVDFFDPYRNEMAAPHRQDNVGPANQPPAAEERPVPQKPKTYDFSTIITVTGVLETVDNYGFLRSSDYNYLASPDDIYVNQAQIKHFGLKTGDVVEGSVRPPKDNEKFFVLTSIQKINGCDPAVVRDRVGFEYLTPLFPDEKFKLCRGDSKDSHSARIVDLFTPIGKGQRALIVAQPKTGKTLLMKDIANSIARNHPEAYLIMLLIDERPEEVTDMARTVNAEVVASTFDAPAENHVKIAGIVLEKAKRMVECGHDVVIFLDSITRLARAYNTVSPASGKVLTGGVDANSLQKPKRFFGAARNIEGGGSLTIVATALIDTGSKMDEVIFEEFKGTGNMELQLDRTLANKRIFPAVNLVASSTRRDELLHDQTTLNRMWILRKHIADMTSLEAMDLMKTYMERTLNNEELLISMNG